MRHPYFHLQLPNRAPKDRLELPIGFMHCNKTWIVKETVEGHAEVHSINRENARYWNHITFVFSIATEMPNLPDKLY